MSSCLHLLLNLRAGEKEREGNQIAEHLLHCGTCLFSHWTAFNFWSFCRCFHSWIAHHSHLRSRPAPLITPPGFFRALAGVQYVAAQEFGLLGDSVLQHLFCQHTLEVSFLAINYYPHSWRNKQRELEHLGVNETLLTTVLSDLFKQGSCVKPYPWWSLVSQPSASISWLPSPPSPDVLWAFWILV